MDIEETANPVADETRVDDTPQVTEGAENAAESTDDLDIEGLVLEMDDVEDVDYEGTTYKVPKPLKDALLRQADYTRKTMELAEQRRAVEAEQVRVSQIASMTTAEVQTLAKLEHLGSELAAFEGVDWASLDPNDPDVTRAKWRFDELRSQQATLGQQFTAHQQAKAAQMQQETAKHREAVEAAAAREIPNWSPAKRDELQKFAANYGYTPEAFSAATAGDYKLLNLASVGAQFIERQKTAARLKAAATAQPAAEINGRTPSVRPLDDRASTEAWMKARQAAITRT